MKRKLQNLLMIFVLLMNVFASLLPTGVVVANNTIEQPKVLEAGYYTEDFTGDLGLLGIASKFHIFTKGIATLGAHTSGNIAAGNLVGSGHSFGTANTSVSAEIHYFQQITSINGSNSRDNIGKFIVGQGVTAGYENRQNQGEAVHAVIGGTQQANGSYSGGTKLDHVKSNKLYQDQPNNQYINLEGEFAKLVKVADDFMTTAPIFKTYDENEFPNPANGNGQNEQIIDIDQIPGDGVVYLNIPARLLNHSAYNNAPLKVYHSKERMVVINVTDRSGDLTVKRGLEFYTSNGNGYSQVGSGERNGQNGNLLWNFGSANGTITFANSHTMGSILAPNANLVFKTNVDGSLIGANVHINGGESHKWDPNPIPTEVPTSYAFTKNWQDPLSQGSNRPKQLTVYLLKGTSYEAALKNFEASDPTTYVDTHTFGTTGDSYTHTFSPLPKLTGGEQYFIHEVKQDFYQEPSIVGNVITNKEETTEVQGTKEWLDNNNANNNRPTAVTLHLVSGKDRADALAKLQNDPDAIIASKRLATDFNKSDANNWQFSFTNLPKYEKGQLIHYFVFEETVTGYKEAKYDDQNKVTNEELPEIELAFTKIWDDQDNVNQNRPDPENLPIKLLKGENRATAIATYQADKSNEVKLDYSTNFSVVKKNDNEFEYRVKNLPQYEHGQPVKYWFVEEQVLGYSAPIYDDSKQTITNRMTKTDFNGEKFWDTANDPTITIPKEIEVSLMVGSGRGAADGRTYDTIDVSKDSQGKWKYAWNNLPTHIKGQAVTYWVEEKAVPGFKTTYLPNSNNLLNTSLTKEIPISFTKIWEDDDNNDGKRPERVIFELHVKGTNNLPALQELTLELTAFKGKNQWQGAFKPVPQFSGGEEIQYEVRERFEGGNPGYTLTTSGSAASGLILINTRKSEEIEIPVQKIWVEYDKDTSKRPSKITYKLYKNDATDEKNLVRKVEIDAKSDSKNDNNNWYYKFEKLAKYENGQEIDYVLLEEQVEDYNAPDITGDNTGFEVINSRRPDEVASNYNISGLKVWQGDEEMISQRPKEIEMYLVYGDTRETGEEIPNTLEKVSADKDGNWKIEWEVKEKDYPDANKVWIVEKSVKNYTTTYKKGEQDKTCVITNTYDEPDPEPKVLEIKGTKTWVGDEKVVSQRPKEIELKLVYGDSRETGKEIPSSAQKVKADKEGNWKYAWNLDGEKYTDAGKVWVVEKTVSGYTTTYDKNHDVVNTYDEPDPEPKVLEIKGTKTWVGDEKVVSQRPKEIELKLVYGDSRETGKEIPSSAQKVKTDKEGNWKYAWTLDGEKYTDAGKVWVVEKTVSGYITTYGKNHDVVNTYDEPDPEPKVLEIKGTKTWVGDEKVVSQRPKEIALYLVYGDSRETGKEIPSSAQTVTADKNGAWSYEWTLDGTTYGDASKVWVVEKMMNHYSVTYQDGQDGKTYNVTNTYTPTTTGGSSTRPTLPNTGRTTTTTTMTTTTTRPTLPRTGFNKDYHLIILGGLIGAVEVLFMKGRKKSK